MSAGDSSFNEVLRLSMDQAQFVADLASIESAWTEALGRMEEVGKSMANPLTSAGATSADFANLTTQLQTLTDGLASAFKSLSDTVLDTMGKAENAIQGVINKEEALGATTRRTAFEKAEIQKGTAYENEEASAQASATKIRSFYDELTSQLIADANKTVVARKVADDESTADFTRSIQIQQTAAGNLGKTLEALAAKSAAARKLADDESTADFVRSYQIQAQAAANLGAELKAMAAEQREANKINEDETTADFVRAYEIRATAAANLGAKLEALNKKQMNDVSLGQGFMKGLIPEGGMAGIAQMAGQFTQWLVIFQAIQFVVNGIKEAILAIPHGLEDGFKFLAQMQEKAVELQPVIARAFNLSPDFQTNFSKAGEAADQVVLKLREQAASLNLDFEKLLVTFKDLSASGAGGLTSNINEAIAAATLMERAIKGMVSDQRESKVIQQEIPALLDGSIAENSKFLDVIKMSKEEWMALLATAKEHHNLLPLLTEKLQEFALAGDRLPTTWNNLVNSMQLFWQELEGGMAKGLFKDMNDAALKLRDYLVEHKAQIQAFGELINKAVTSMFDLVASTVELVDKLGALPMLGKAFGITIIAVLESINAIVGALALVPKLLADASNKDTGQGWKDAKQDFDEYKTSLLAGSDAMHQFITNKKKATEGGSDLLNQDTSGSDGPKDLDSTKLVSAAHKELTQVLAEQKTKYDAIREAAKATAIDARDSAKIVVQSYKDQAAAAAEAVGEANQKIMGDINVSPKDMFAGVQANNDLLDKDQLAATKGTDAELRAVRKARLEATLEDYHEGLKQIENAATEELAISKEVDEETNRSAKESAAQRKDIFENKYQAIVTLVNNYKDQIKQLGGTEKQFDPDTIIASAHAQDSKDTASSDRAGAIQDQKEAQRNYQVLLDAAKKFYADDEAMAKEMHARGLSDNTQFVHAKIKAYEDEYQAQHDILTKESVDTNLTFAQRQTALSKIDALEAEHTRKGELNSAQLTDAVLKDYELRAANEARLSAAIEQGATQQKLAQDKLLGNKAQEAKDVLELTNLKLKEVTVTLELAQAKLLAMGPLSLENEAYQKQLLVIQNLIREKQGLAALSTQQGTSADFFGRGTTTTVDPTTGDSSTSPNSVWVELNTSARNLKEVFGGLSSVVGSVQQGLSRGGTLGGIGAGLSAAGGLAQSDGIGKLAGALGAGAGITGAIPIVGAAMQAIGPVISMISGIFTKAAQEAADQIQKAVGNIKDAFASGQANLIQTLNALQQQKQDAITQLSGMKGGQDQLNKILPGLDSQIAQLQGQQKQIIDNFTNQTVIMGQFTKEGQQWLTTWKDINQQVKDFLGAGGSKDEAALFLKEQLAQQTKDITAQYDSAEQQAIKDTIGLNSLLTQRQQLLDQINNISASLNDSVQRREAGAIVAGKTARDHKTALQEQLAAMDEQIAVQTKTVAAEKQLFGLTSNIADLHRLDESLSLVALQNQIAEWTKLQQLMKSLTGTPIVPSAQTGLFAGSSPFAGIPGGIPGAGATTTVNITGPITIGQGIDPRNAGRDFGRGIQDELDYRYRSRGQ